MNDDRIALAQLLEKGSDTDWLREMLGFVSQRLMQAEVEARVGAEPGERSESRSNWRNAFSFIASPSSWRKTLFALFNGLLVGSLLVMSPHS
jgi:hypothetical protein